MNVRFRIYAGITMTKTHLVQQISDEEHRARDQADQRESRLSLRHLGIRFIRQEERGSLPRNRRAIQGVCIEGKGVNNLV